MAQTSLQEFLRRLHQNYNILKEREAKYAAAAPLDLLNQIDDYQEAIAKTEQALAQNISLEALQAEFNGLNLQLSAVVFVPSEPTRQPFTSENPYRGLLKFTEADARFFFGRNEAIQNLLERVQRLVGTETSLQNPDLMAVLGASGSGKSSLVRAGLIRALRAGRIPGSEQWRIKVMLPGPRPLDALAEIFVSQVGRGLAAIRAELDGGEKALHYLMVESLTGKPDSAVFALVVDQFEELFTLTEQEAERRAFLEQLLYACQVRRNRSLVILTMRADFYAKVTAYKALAEVITLNQMLVSPMTEKELREAILLPAEAVGLELEKDLVQALVADTVEAPGALPLLQHALLELFQQRDGNLLTMKAYREIGGIKGALAQRADSVLAALTGEQQALARTIFLRLTALGEGVSDTRRRVQRARLYPASVDAAQLDIVLDALTGEQARLLVADEQTVEVTHDALIQQWGTLREWLEENREAERIRQRLTEAADEWDAKGGDPGYLYQDARLAQVREWARSHSAEMTALEQAFLTTSVAEQEREVREEEARRQRELEQAQTLVEEQRQRAEEQKQAAANLRKRALIATGIGIIALIAAIAAGFFGWQSTENAKVAQNNANLAATREAQARQQADIAVAHRLAAEGRLQYEQNPLLGLRLAIEGWKLSSAYSQIDQSIREMARHGRLLTLGQDLENIYFNPERTSFIIDRIKVPGELRHTADGALLNKLTGAVEEVTFSPDTPSTYFFVKYSDNTPSELRRTANGAVVTSLATSTSRVGFIGEALNYVVVYGSEGTPKELRRTANGAIVPLSGSLAGIEFSSSANSNFVVYYSDNTPGELRSATTGVVVTTLSGPVKDVEFSLDKAGSYFVVEYSHNLPSELRRTADGSRVKVLSGPVSMITFSPDEVSRYFVVEYGDELPAELRHTTDGSLIVTLLHPVGDKFFSRDKMATLLVVHYRDLYPELHRTDDGQVVPLPGDFITITFSPDEVASYFEVDYSDELPTELRRTADASLVDLSGPIDYINFNVDPSGNYFAVHYMGGILELRRMKDAAPIPLPDLISSDGTTFQVVTTGYFIVEYYGGSKELRRLTDGTVVPLSGGISHVAVSPDKAISYFTVYFDDGTAELHRSADTSLVDLPPAISKVSFLEDEAVRYLIVSFQNAQSELWRVQDQPRHLAELGLGLENYYFDALNEQLITEYLDGRAYLLDLVWLQAMGDQAETMPIEKLIRLACAGPFAGPVWGEADEAALQAYLGEGREPRACR